jgi:putative glutamine amidotransferase
MCWANLLPEASPIGKHQEGIAVTDRPLIGVICCKRRIGVDAFQAVAERYLDALIRFAEVDAVLIPALPEVQDVRRVLRRLDGVLLTGSPSNVEPRRYGGDAPGVGPFDPGRDSVAMALIAETRAQDKPLMGICRGFQEINVAYGGSLRPDLGAPERELAHHAREGTDFDGMFEHRHMVDLTPGGPLDNALGGPRIEVNSVHYQGVDRLAPHLTVEAVSSDGIVEAVRLDDDKGKLLAVQWHPEWRAEVNPVSLRLYRLFGQMARGANLAEAARAGRGG